MTDRPRPTNPFVEFPLEALEHSIPRRFEEQVARYPDRSAVTSGSQTLTYESLNGTANRVARAILDARGPGEEPIALLLEHDALMVAAILGILKAGKIYVPLDPSAPPARLHAVLEDAQAGLIVTSYRHRSLAADLARDGRRLIDCDEIGSAWSPDNLKLTIPPDTGASILYTSGSTGTPKGVVHTHRTILYKVMTYTNDLHFWRDDRVALLSPCTFSLSVGFLFGALLNAACLHPRDVQGDLAAWLRQERITVYNSVPTVFRTFTDALTGEETFPALRLIHLGGEPVSAHDVDVYKRHFADDCLLLHHLGSNETGTIAQYFIDKATRTDGHLVPAGYAADGAEILVLDDAGRRLGPDHVGDIALKSRYLSPGYWRRPDLTRAAFRPDPDGSAARIYLTGDVGRLRPDGLLLYLGRKDRMVKIRGHRVEVAEVETVLTAHPRVKEAAVVAAEQEAGEQYLVAYVVPRDEPAPTVSDLRTFLGPRLPDPMIPSVFVVLEGLPKTNGKIDRRSLPRPERLRPRLKDDYVPPGRQVEQRLVSIWEDVLDIRPIGIDDDFFELGGHSLLAASLLARLDQAFGLALPLGVLVTAPTVRLLADHYASSNGTGTAAAIVPLTAAGDRPPVYAMPGLYGNVLCYADLSRALGAGQPFYALESVGLDGRAAPLASIEEMATVYLRDVRSIQPHGPYALIGACFGGTVAYEMTRQLLEAGEDVAFLGLLDPVRREVENDGDRTLSAPRAFRRAQALADFLATRLQRYAEEAQSRRRGERLKFITSKIRTLGSRMRAPRRLLAVQRELHQREVYRANVAAFYRYLRRPLNGQLGALELFESMHPRNVNVATGPDWDALWRGRTKRHRVPGKDSGDMMIGQNGQVLAALLAERLRAAFDQASTRA